MSRLDELKSGVATQEQGIDIDMTADIDGIDHSKEQQNRVNITAIGNNSTRKKVSPQEMAQAMGVNTGSDEPTLDEKDYIPENSIQNPEAFATGVLNGQGSLLENWKKEKIEEYQERMAEFDEEREELIDEGKLNPKDIKDPEYNDGLDIDEDIEDEENTDEDDSINEASNANLILDNDDLFADSDSDFNDIENDDIENEEVSIEEKTESETIVEDNHKEVHITEEDQELFDTVGGEVDSSRFIDEDDEDDEAPITKKESKNSDDDEDEDDEDSADDTDPDETLKHLKELITAKLQPTFKKIDINQFKIVSKKASSTNIRPITDGQQLKVVKWVLPNQKQCVFMKQFTGLELQTLSENIQEGSTTSMNIAYRMIYDHIVSNKPKKFTDWLAVTPDSDIDHYMFCVFLASYKGSNYLPMNCPNDNCPDPTFLTDDINVMDMVKFRDDDAKNQFTSIYKSEIVYSNAAGYYVTATTPVSNQIAISFKESTLKDVIDIDTLDERFRTRYRTTIGLIPYIDTIYQMDIASQTLEEIRSKEYDSPIKTLKTKIRKYAKVIDTLSSDEFGVISAIIQDISNREDMISYIIPEVECPACGRKIDEVATSATQLVFTRYQLGALVNTSLN